MKYLYLFLVVSLSSFIQLMVKFTVLQQGNIGQGFSGKIHFIFKTLLHPGILCVILAAFATGLLWILVIQEMDLNKAYPVLSLTFVVVPLCSHYLFGESLSGLNMFGLVLIVTGLILATHV